MSGLSIIVATCGRATLSDTLASIAAQLEPGDELLVDVNDDAPWGHRARNRTMRKVTPGRVMLFIDDDDRYLPGALARVRAAVHAQPARIHIFRIAKTDGRPFVWSEPVLRVDNVSTQCFAVPWSAARSASWGDRYAGDYDFIAAAVAALGEPVFHDDVIAILRPHEEASCS